MKKRLDPQSPEYRDLLNKISSTKINLPPLIQKVSSPIFSKRTLTETKDVDLLILSGLNDKDLFSFCSVNKYANKLCKDESFWMNRFLKRFGIAHKPDNILWRNYYLQVIVDIEKYKNPWRFFEDVLRNHPTYNVFHDIFITPNIDVSKLPNSMKNQYYYLNLGNASITFQSNIDEEGDGIIITREYKDLTPEKLLRIIYDFYQEPISLEEFKDQKKFGNKLTRKWSETDAQTGKIKRLDMFYTKSRPVFDGFSHYNGRNQIQVAY